MERRDGETKSESLSLSTPKCIKGKFSFMQQIASASNFKEDFCQALEGFFFSMEIQLNLIQGSRGPSKGISDNSSY